MFANANQQGNEQKLVHATPLVTATPTWHCLECDGGGEGGYGLGTES